MGGVELGHGGRGGLYLQTEPAILLGTVAADGFGRFFDQQVTLPDPAAGGPNEVVGIGRTSLSESAPASFTISPGAAMLDPPALVEGQSTTFSASGFIPGEEVSVSFPFDDPVTAVADDLGSIVVGLIAPAEPAPGGDLIATAGSGTAWTPFTTIAAMTITGTPVPGSIPVSVSGFEGDELVAVDVDGFGTVALRTDLRGSGQTTVTAPVTFGLHTVNATGLRSGVTASTTVTLDATMALDPTKGAPGVVVAVTSGPGWVPLSAVDLYAQGRFVGTFTADLTGAIDAEVTVPEVPPGWVVFRFHDSILGQTARATFRVTP